MADESPVIVPPIVIPLEPAPIPEPPPPPRVGPPEWNWGPSTVFMIGGNYNVGT